MRLSGRLTKTKPRENSTCVPSVKTAITPSTTMLELMTRPYSTEPEPTRRESREPNRFRLRIHTEATTRATHA